MILISDMETSLSLQVKESKLQTKSHDKRSLQVWRFLGHCGHGGNEHCRVAGMEISLSLLVRSHGNER